MAPAKWDALVDRALFEKVVQEAERRKSQPRDKKRTSKGTFLLRPACAHCGMNTTAENGKKQGSACTYVHPKPHKVHHPEIYDAYVEHECRGWTVLADELEGRSRTSFSVSGRL